MKKTSWSWSSARAVELLNPVGEIELVDMGLADRPTDLNGLRIATVRCVVTIRSWRSRRRARTAM